LKDVLYVPTITKKFVSIGQMVEQGLQVTFNPKWMFCGRHEKLRQIDCKREKEWTNVHLGCEHVGGEFHVIHKWKRSWRH